MKKDYKFNQYYKSLNVFSIALILLSLIFLIFKGLNYGVDFKGGTLIEIRVEPELSTKIYARFRPRCIIGDRQDTYLAYQRTSLILSFGPPIPLRCMSALLLTWLNGWVTERRCPSTQSLSSSCPFCCEWLSESSIEHFPSARF